MTTSNNPDNDNDGVLHDVFIIGLRPGPPSAKVAIAMGKFPFDDQNMFFRSIQASVESFTDKNGAVFTFHELYSYQTNRNFRTILKRHGITEFKVLDFEPTRSFAYDFNFNIKNTPLESETFNYAD